MNLITLHALFAVAFVGAAIQSWSYLVATLVVVATLFVWSGIGYLTDSLTKQLEALTQCQTGPSE